MSASRNYENLYRFAVTLQQNQQNMHRTLQQIVAGCGSAVDVQTGCLITFRDDDGVDNIYLLGATSARDASHRIWERLVRHGIIGHAYHSSRSIIVRDLSHDPRWPEIPENNFLPASGSAIALPLISGEVTYAVLLLVHRELDYFHGERLALLHEMASLAANNLHNALELHQLRTGELRYQALFDSAIVPILLTDLQGQIIDANDKACELLGYSHTDLRHMAITDLHHEIGSLLAVDPPALDEEQVLQTNIITASEQRIMTAVRLRRMHLRGRDILEWVEQDLGAQMAVEQLRRDLTAMVYHDLRGPLQAILGAMHRLESLEKEKEGPAHRLLEIGLRGARQLQRMVDSLLDVQQLEAGQSILKPQTIEVSALTNDALQLVLPLAADAGQTINSEVASDLPQLRIDRDMILRVIVNLLENAVKYTPDGGRIQIGASRQGEMLRIWVRDNGPGIPQDMRRSIFDKFSRVRYEDAPKGLGLGLAFCRLAVEAHGGQIWVEDALGAGSEFTFTLPLRTEQQDDSATKLAEPA